MKKFEVPEMEVAIFVSENITDNTGTGEGGSNSGWGNDD